MITESPMRTSACMIAPSGRPKRSFSWASNAVQRSSADRQSSSRHYSSAVRAISPETPEVTFQVTGGVFVRPIVSVLWSAYDLCARSPGAFAVGIDVFQVDVDAAGHGSEVARALDPQFVV